MSHLFLKTLVAFPIPGIQSKLLKIIPDLAPPHFADIIFLRLLHPCWRWINFNMVDIPYIATPTLPSRFHSNRSSLASLSREVHASLEVP